MNKSNWVRNFTTGVITFLMSQVVFASSSILLSWKVPTTRENGQPLPIAELKGYEISYVREDLAVTNAFQINNGSTSSYVLKNLAAGKYYAAVSAIDVNGLKSKFSPSVPFTVDSSAAPSAPTSIAVSSVTSYTSTGAIKVSWIAPTTRTDGSALSLKAVWGYSIVVYRVLISGTQVSTSRVMAATTLVNGSNSQSYMFNNVVKGTYLVVLSATDVDGAKSKVISKGIKV